MVAHLALNKSVSAAADLHVFQNAKNAPAQFAQILLNLLLYILYGPYVRVYAGNISYLSSQLFEKAV